MISEERRRVEELKRRVQDEVRSQWEERKMNCASFNSVESGEESSSYSTGLTERYHKIFRNLNVNLIKFQSYKSS